MKKIIYITLFFCSFSGFAQNDDSLMIRKIFDEALANGHSYENLRVLCKDVGARLSGSPEAEKAVRWGEKLLKDYQFDSVWLMPVIVPHWVRGNIENVGFVASKFDEKNGITVQSKFDAKSLGGSVATNGRIEAEVVEVQSFEELAELGKKNIKGKIVYFSRPMDPKLINTGKAYGGCVGQRWAGAMEAAKYDAVGVILRSVTHHVDHHAHTGVMGYNDSLPKIPAIAISLISANELSKRLKENPKQKVYMEMNCQMLPDVDSYNVIGEIKGNINPEHIITVGGHLDSWDVGEGAHDDGAGIIHSFEALRILKDIGYKPNNTLRVVFFMNEENGNRGGIKYAELSEKNGWKHIAAIESDAGGLVPRGFGVDGTKEQVEKVQSWASLLKPYNLHHFEAGWGGVDIGPLKSQNVPLIGLIPDTQRYFDYHHTDNDVFENVHKRELELGCGSVASLIYLIDKYGL